jgi:hypothetical protein
MKIIAQEAIEKEKPGSMYVIAAKRNRNSAGVAHVGS